MKKVVLKVPRGIRFISDWCKLSDGYGLEHFQFPHLLNKQITGCGFTEYCLTNNLDTIVCSPRKILLENKEDQHQGEVFYFKNEFLELSQENYDQDISSNSSILRAEKDAIVEKARNADDYEVVSKRLFKLKGDLLSYIDFCHSTGKPIKILVTYDSFHLVREFIESSGSLTMDSFYVVIDEFQSLMVDSRFKSDTELGFLRNLCNISKLCFVSATPMLDTYLDMLDEFKELPYFELDWKSEEDTRVIKPIITVKASTSLITDAKNVINSYLDGYFEKYVFTDELGRVGKVESREAVLYFNSVKNICDIIRKCKLTPDNTNVLCSTTLTNLALVKKAFKDSCGRKDGSIGTVPKYGEPHKMFTLCTRTVYLGADFYSTNARSFIFSDPNIDCLAVDISLDLPQILGRQRLNINPWKNSATLFYKVINKNKKLSKAEFDSIVSSKYQKTSQLLESVKSIGDFATRVSVLETYEDAIKATHYSKSYLSINRDDKGNLIPVFNNLVMVSEMRAFDVQQIDYRNRFSVFNSVEISANSTLDTSLDSSILKFDELVGFPEKMEFVCNLVRNSGLENVIAFLNSIPVQYKNYIMVLGPERCAAFSYRKSLLDEELNKCLSNQEIDVSSIIYNTFEVGKKYTLSDTKQILRSIYETAGVLRSPKAVDLEEYFNVFLTSIYLTVGSEKKKFRAYEILSRKDI